MALGDLEYIEGHFRLDMGKCVIGVSHLLPEFQTKLRIEQRNGRIRCHAVAVVVGGVVRQSSQSESVFVQILRLQDEVDHEVAGPHIVQKIGEKFRAERVIAHVLNDAASVGVGVRLLQLLRRTVGESFEKQSLDGGVPQRVDDRFVSQNRISEHAGGGEQHQETK